MYHSLGFLDYADGRKLLSRSLQEEEEMLVCSKMEVMFGWLGGVYRPEVVACTQVQEDAWWHLCNVRCLSHCFLYRNLGFCLVVHLI